MEPMMFAISGTLSNVAGIRWRRIPSDGCSKTQDSLGARLAWRRDEAASPETPRVAGDEAGRDGGRIEVRRNRRAEPTVRATTTPMQTAFEIARGLSALAFLFYGITCLATTHMVAEFERYRLARLRRTVGVLECLGALGLVAGHFSTPLLIAAAAGLALLMLAGIATRIRIGDSLAQMLPAAALLLLNAFVLGVAIARA
jgi:hypothetical protein